MNRSQGGSYGLELSLKRPFSKQLGGYLSYTLSRSTRSVGRETFPSSFDRTHVLSSALGYDLGRRWTAGARYTFYTGRPSSRVNANGLRPRSPDRLPPFHRLDLRLEKKWRLGQSGYWSLVFEFLNATLSREAISDECDATVCTVNYIGPISIPNIGLEAAF